MITLLLGPMFSGKTTQLLSFERRFQLAKRNVLIIKYLSDTRYSLENVVSHDGVNSTTSVVNALTIGELLTTSTSLLRLQSSDAILVDEGQFFPDLRVLCETFGNDKQIVISALNGDYKQDAFQPICDVIGMADNIVHCKSICSNCGADAPHTIRTIASQEQQLIGGSESYQPRCRRCLRS